MILTVHDELLFEVPRPAEEFGAIVRDRMQSAAELEVPLTSTSASGRTGRTPKIDQPDNMDFTANNTFAGRSASRRMYQGNHSSP